MIAATEAVEQDVIAQGCVEKAFPDILVPPIGPAHQQLDELFVQLGVHVMAVAGDLEIGAITMQVPKRSCTLVLNSVTIEYLLKKCFVIFGYPLLKAANGNTQRMVARRYGPKIRATVDEVVCRGPRITGDL